MGLFDNLIPQQAQQTQPSQGGLFDNLIPQNQAPAPTAQNPDYDMAGYVAKYGQPNQDNGQHLTDEFKLPNHITFSNESRYSNPQTPGGQWKLQPDEDMVAGHPQAPKWNYYASDYNLTQHTPQQMTDYFKNTEPNSVLHLPNTTSNDVGVNNPGKPKPSAVPSTYIGANGLENMNATEAPNHYGRYVAASPFMSAVRYGNEIGKASGEIPDDTYAVNNQTVANFNQQKAAEGAKISGGQRFVKDVAYNPLTYLPWGKALQGLGLLGRLGVGTGIGATFAAAQPNATPGSVVGGAATGLGFAGAGEAGVAGYNAFMSRGADTSEGALLSNARHWYGGQEVPPEKPVINSTKYEAPTDVVAAAQADPHLNLPAYNYDTINQAAQTEGVAGQAAKEYAKRLLVATTTERNEMGTPLLIHSGNLDAGASKLGESLAAEPLSGVNNINVRQGEQLKTALTKEWSDAKTQTNNIPYEFEDPNRPLGGHLPTQVQSGVDKPGADNLDIIKTSFAGRLAENKAISNKNYAQIDTNISNALKNDSTLPTDFLTNDEGLPERMSYQDAKLQVSKWETQIDKMVKSGNRIDAYGLMQRKEALEDAANYYAGTVIPGDPAPAIASNFYRENVAPYQNKNGGIIQTIRAVDSDTALNRLFNPTAEDKFSRNFDMLDPKGQQAMRTELLERAIAKGNGMGDRELNLQNAFGYLHDRQDQVGHAFGGVDDAGNGTNPILNLVNFSRNAPQAGVRSGGLSKLDQLTRLGSTVGAGAAGTFAGGVEGGLGAVALKTAYQYGKPAYQGYKYIHPDISPYLIEAPQGPRGINFSPREVSPITPGQPNLPESAGTPALSTTTPTGGVNTIKTAVPVNPPNAAPLPAQPMGRNWTPPALNNTPGPASVGMAPERPTLGMGSLGPAKPMPQTTTPGQVTPIGPQSPTYSAYPTPTTYKTIVKGPITPPDESYSLTNNGLAHEAEMKMHIANATKIRTKAEYDVLEAGRAYTAADGTQGVKQ